MKAKMGTARICVQATKGSHGTRMRQWKSLRATSLIVFLWAAAAVLSSAQAVSPLAPTFTLLHSFAGLSAGDGANPEYGSLVQGFDGNLYGTTTYGGSSCSFSSAGCGEVFKITTGGSISSLYKFCPAGSCPDGNFPEGGLALDTKGNLYGMTTLGGVSDAGTVFHVTAGAAPKFKTIFSFDITDGAYPLDTLLRTTNGSFYGTTQSGGAIGYGAIFKISAAGVQHFVQSFNTTTGLAQSEPAGLVQDSKGNFYGVTSTGGPGTDGVVFKMTPAGKFTILHAFSGIPDGQNPGGTLALGPNGNFYGTTRQGGLTGNGTVFEVTPAGVYTILYNFCTVNGCPDGFDPNGLILGSDGNFYGTTRAGGTGSPGTIFQFAPSGALTTLHNFNGISDGSEPFAGLVQHTDGNFYGTAYTGGANGYGTVFSLSVGLSPFVETLPSSGRAGNAVKILGDNLLGTTAVNFNGTAAIFNVVSNTEITATVPVGAITGKVTLTTPSGILTSNVPFVVP